MQNQLFTLTNLKVSVSFQPIPHMSRPLSLSEHHGRFLWNAWQGIPIISCRVSHVEHTSSVRYNMTERSQVRWAILLSFIALKVRRMKSLAPFVSQCWPWLQVIKALLSFCQSSDSPNISPWLISAVSSVRAYTKSGRINTESFRSLCT